MKFCEECGAQLEDDAVFCEECGAQIDDTPLPPPVVPQKIQKKSKLPILIGAIGGAVLVAVIVIVVVVVMKKGNKDVPVVNNDATTLAGEVETTGLAKDNVTEAPETEETTAIEITTEETTAEDYYKYYDQFILFIYSSCSDFPYFNDVNEQNAYCQKIYKEWKNGESWNNVVIAEDGNIYYSIFDCDAKYAVYDVMYYDPDFELYFCFQIRKEGNKWSALYGEMNGENSVAYECDSINDYVCYSRENRFTVTFIDNKTIEILLNPILYGEPQIKLYFNDLDGSRYLFSEKTLNYNEYVAYTYDNINDYYAYINR